MQGRRGIQLQVQYECAARKITVRVLVSWTVLVYTVSARSGLRMWTPSGAMCRHDSNCDASCFDCASSLGQVGLRLAVRYRILIIFDWTIQLKALIPDRVCGRLRFVVMHRCIVEYNSSPSSNSRRL